MRYVIANKTLAGEKGFSLKTHRTHGDLMLLNEKEVVNNPALHAGSLADRASEIAGTVYTCAAVKHVLNEGGWNG